MVTCGAAISQGWTDSPPFSIQQCTMATQRQTLACPGALDSGLPSMRLTIRCFHNSQVFTLPAAFSYLSLHRLIAALVRHIQHIGKWCLLAVYWLLHILCFAWPVYWAPKLVGRWGLLPSACSCAEHSNSSMVSCKIRNSQQSSQGLSSNQ